MPVSDEHADPDQDRGTAHHRTEDGDRFRHGGEERDKARKVRMQTDEIEEALIIRGHDGFVF